MRAKELDDEDGERETILYERGAGHDTAQWGEVRPALILERDIIHHELCIISRIKYIVSRRSMDESRSFRLGPECGLGPLAWLVRVCISCFSWSRSEQTDGNSWEVSAVIVWIISSMDE